ncbi:hypothetical protein [Streptomyces sp. NPDC048560]|uniref:hypothetical protein n=1 Tax=Streptomyces sp. NPDC048560 TaxID=3155488 RepID=UPI0034441F0A
MARDRQGRELRDAVRHEPGQTLERALSTPPVPARTGAKATGGRGLTDRLDTLPAPDADGPAEG